MQHWHVVYTRPQQEFRANYELLNQRFETYIPQLGSKPLFPRYLFCRFDRDQDNWGLIRSTRGCIDLLKNGFLPISVHDTVMAAIMDFETRTDQLEAEPQYTKGQRITVTHGPFSSFEGLFQESAKDRVKVLLELFGSKREIEIPLLDIAPAA